MTMNGFFASLFAEMGARRRRMRAAFGDRGQALVEFLVLGGLLLGSLGLFVREGMADKAAWGFALPPVFVIGFLAIDARRQAQSKRRRACAMTGSRCFGRSAAPYWALAHLCWRGPVSRMRRRNGIGSR